MHFVVLILAIYSIFVISYYAKLININDNSEDSGQSVYNFTECTSDDFKGNEECSLICTASLESLYEWHWIYYVNNSLDKVILYDGVDRIDFPSSNSTQITLTLANYSAGTYQCWYHYISAAATSLTKDETAAKDFQVDPGEKGVALEEPCETSTQCLSLDATCENDTCQCVSPFIYPMQTSRGAIACLKGVGPFEPCNIDEQCIAAGENYKCIKSICDCTASYTYVAEVNKYLCLFAVSEGQVCQYQEECALTDVSMWCYDNVCDCIDNYSFNDTLNQCINASYYPDDYPSDDGLSFGAIIGIIIGTAAGIVILFAIVGLIITLRSRH